MITAILGRFFRHCIAQAEALRREVEFDQFDPEYMTDQEISWFVHGRLHLIDWPQIRLRKKTGALARPKQHTAVMELLP